MSTLQNGGNEFVSLHWSIHVIISKEHGYLYAFSWVLICIVYLFIAWVVQVALSCVEDLVLND